MCLKIWIQDEGVKTACIVKGDLWKICKECDPAYQGSKECYFNPITECKCMNIIVNGKGIESDKDWEPNIWKEEILWSIGGEDCSNKFGLEFKTL